MSSVTEARCQSLMALPSWLAYTSASTGAAYAQVVSESTTHALRDCVPAALARHFSACGEWRVAQHVALEVLSTGRHTYVALHFADQAVKLSGGNALARVLVARCFWMQRFPDAVLHHLRLLRHDVQHFQPAARRAQLHAEIADLYANVYCYFNRLDLARPWIERVLREPGDRLATFRQIFSTVFGEDPALELRIAQRLALAGAPLSGRDLARVTRVLRHHLIATVGARP